MSRVFRAFLIQNSNKKPTKSATIKMIIAHQQEKPLLLPTLSVLFKTYTQTTHMKVEKLRHSLGNMVTLVCFKRALKRGFKLN